MGHLKALIKDIEAEFDKEQVALASITALGILLCSCVHRYQKEEDDRAVDLINAIMRQGCTDYRLTKVAAVH
jgi:hypothetical protein